MGGDPGVWDEAEDGVWFWVYGHQELRRQLLPEHSNADPLQRP